MAKTFLKKLCAFAVIGITLVPMSFVRAASSASDTVIDNIVNATSSDMNVSIDLTMKTDEIAQPISVHAGIDGASNAENEGMFDYSFWSTDQNGTFEKHTGSIVITSDTLYLQQDNDMWYFLNRTSANAPSDADIQEGADAMKSFVTDMFDYGVVEYTTETVDIINGIVTTRYAYTVNNDVLLSYLEEKGYITADQVADSTFADDTVISGNFWIDTTAMLPVMFTMNIASTPSETSYTNVQLSVLFNSFNQPVTITEPTGAIDLATASWDTTSLESVATTVATAASTNDTDGDGLSDIEEKKLWHTSTHNTDTDGDGYSDYTEVINGYSPMGFGKLDSDGDSLTDYAELTIHWTNRHDTDSDNDGYDDGTEVANGYDPNGIGRY